MPVPAPRRRRSELTFKHNTPLGRHGWLRLTPAYSVRLVQQLLDEHDAAKNVVDPFSGTGTTTLCAVERGHRAVSFDINPFLVWLGNLKLRRFDDHELVEIGHAAGSILAQSMNGDAEQAPLPALSNIRRWWNPADLVFVRRLLTAIRSHSFHSDGVRDLLLVSFCRTMIGLSNAAFNHQSMSFKDAANPQAGLFDDNAEERQRIQFQKDVAVVEAGAGQEPGPGQGRVVLADSRNLPAAFADAGDLLIPIIWMLLLPTIFPVDGPKHSTCMPFSAGSAVTLSVDVNKVAFVSAKPVIGVAVKAMLNLPTGPQTSVTADI